MPITGYHSWLGASSAAQSGTGLRSREPCSTSANRTALHCVVCRRKPTRWAVCVWVACVAPGSPARRCCPARARPTWRKASSATRSSSTQSAAGWLRGCSLERTPAPHAEGAVLALPQLTAVSLSLGRWPSLRAPNPNPNPNPNANPNPPLAFGALALPLGSSLPSDEPQRRPVPIGRLQCGRAAVRLGWRHRMLP